VTKHHNLSTILLANYFFYRLRSYSMNRWILRTPLTLLTVLILVLGIVPAVSALSAASTDLPLHFLRSADCTGEEVEISGTIHMVNKTLADGSVISHFNYQNVSGVGLTSGDTYRVSAVDHLQLKAPFPSSISSVRNFHLISQGSSSDLIVQALYHITVNVNGEVTASIDDLSMQCT
jgi:hypothetical protein